MRIVSVLWLQLVVARAKVQHASTPKRLRVIKIAAALALALVAVIEDPLATLAAGLSVVVDFEEAGAVELVAMLWLRAKAIPTSRLSAMLAAPVVTATLLVVLTVVWRAICHVAIATPQTPIAVFAAVAAFPTADVLVSWAASFTAITVRHQASKPH